jgi:hypothetical protein
MSFFFRKSDTSVLGKDLVEVGGEELGFFDSISSGYYEQRYARNSDAEIVLLDEYFEPILDTIIARGGPKFTPPSHHYGDTDSVGHSERMRVHKINEIIGYVKENSDLFPEYQDLTIGKINDDIISRAQDELKRSEEEAKKAHGLGRFIGSAGGFFTDRNFLETSTLTAGLGRVAEGSALWRTALRFGLVEAGREAAIQPAVKEWYEKLGLDYDYKDFLMNVGTVGVTAGGLPFVGRGVALTFDQARSGVNALRKDRVISEDDANSIRASIDEAELETETLVDGVEVDPIEHLKNLDDATADVHAGRFPGETDVPTRYDPLPTVEDIEELTPDTYARALDDLDDDEIILIGDEVEGYQEFSGVALKQEFEQTQSKLDRLRGCVVR